MAETAQPTTPPPEPRGFTELCAIYEQAGLVPWARIRDARRALGALCAEQDTERERYRQETINAANEALESEAGE